jgi:hypothetical protein
MMAGLDCLLQPCRRFRDRIRAGYADGIEPLGPRQILDERAQLFGLQKSSSA